MDEKLKKLARQCGAEADENQFNLSEYYEDFCLFLGVERWRDVPGNVKLEILEYFKMGAAENKQARRQFGRE